MKKIVIALILLITGIMLVSFFYKPCCFEYQYVAFKDSEDIIAVMDFAKEHSELSKADRILWYCLFTNYSIMKNGEEDFITFTKESVIAFEVDLDDDGIDEIVGTSFSSLSWGNKGGSFYVLKKNHKGEYDLFFSFSMDVGVKKIYVLKSKTNNFHDLIIENQFGERYRQEYIRY